MKKSTLICFFVCSLHVYTQTVFTKLPVDDANPITEEGPDAGTGGGYVGCAWVDYNNDGLLDMFAVRNAIYRNEGGGMFSKVTTSGINTIFGYGTTWSDYNNDGYIDCFLSGGNTFGSSLYKNNGDGTFSKNTNSDLYDSLSLRGWGSAFGDINNDGFTDIVIAAPFGFAAITDSNKLLLNQGDEHFIKLDTSRIEQMTAPYTVPTWSDYDFDGDLDCFIGSGPANGTVQPDFLYKNEFMETGNTGYFTKITTNPIATDAVDGQVWNWIDYDNDGDLDAYLTNYWGGFASGMPNNLYRNDGGTFVKLTETDAGSIVTDGGFSLSSTWQDFDNDADLDCFVTNDGPDFCAYYDNNGDGTFTRINDIPMYFSGYFWGASAGDYDNDGDVDLYVMGAENGKALYRNDTNNGYHWVNMLLQGTESNRSAIGARVKCKAIIDGNPVWQLRDVNAQNSFNSMHSLNVEFGLKDASVIDTVIIYWPSGQVDICTNIAVNTFYTVQEGTCNFTSNVINESDNITELKLFPNPTSRYVTVTYTLTDGASVQVAIIDSNGKTVHAEKPVNLAAGKQSMRMNVKKLPSGTYTCILKTGRTIMHSRFEIFR